MRKYELRGGAAPPHTNTHTHIPVHTGIEVQRTSVIIHFLW